MGLVYVVLLGMSRTVMEAIVSYGSVARNPWTTTSSPNTVRPVGRFHFSR